MVAMTGTCYWAFSYTREGFIPQMYGSIRVCCAATTELDDYTEKGIQWGDCKSLEWIVRWLDCGTNVY